MTDREEFEALTELVLGEPVLTYTNMGQMYREIQEYKPQPKALWMSPPDFKRMWESVIPQQRYVTAAPERTSYISWCGIPIKCLPS